MSNFYSPLNIGSEEMVSISQLVDIVSKIANKNVTKKFKLDAPIGVRGRNSDNKLMRKELGWDYTLTLEDGIAKTYEWILGQISAKVKI
jgi:nucleoside-diphosphate-sugar epimerase